MEESVVKETEQFEPAPEGYLYANVDESHKLIIINQIDAQEQGLPLVEFEQGYDGELYEKGYAPTQPKEEQNEIIKQTRASLYEKLVDPLHAEKQRKTVLGTWTEADEAEYVAEVKRLTQKIQDENPYIE